MGPSKRPRDAEDGEEDEEPNFDEIDYEGSFDMTIAPESQDPENPEDGPENISENDPEIPRGEEREAEREAENEEDPEREADAREEVAEGEDAERENTEEDKSPGSVPRDPPEFQHDVEDLPGVGRTIAKKLTDAGYATLQALSTVPKALLMEEAGLGEKTAEKIILAAQQALNIGFKTADEVWERRKNIKRLTTGSPALDELIGGGIETGSLSEFFGEYRTGKTQIMHQLAVNVQLPVEVGGLGGSAIYIDTENTFRPERIIQMAEDLALDYEAVLKNIVIARAYNSDHQNLLIKEAAKIVAEKNVKLVIVDSIIGHYRSEFIGRGTLASRQQSLNVHIHALQRLAETYDVAVVFTNQVQSKPDVFFGDPTRATGGHVLAHGATIRMYLRKGKGQQRICRLVDSPHLPDGETVFQITEEGIRDV